MQIQGQYSLLDFSKKILGGHKLSDFNEEYEKIMRSSIKQSTKTNALAELMTLMEGRYSIILSTKEGWNEWKENNKEAYALYKKISDSRVLE